MRSIHDPFASRRTRLWTTFARWVANALFLRRCCSFETCLEWFDFAETRRQEWSCARWAFEARPCDSKSWVCASLTQQVRSTTQVRFDEQWGQRVYININDQISCWQSLTWVVPLRLKLRIRKWSAASVGLKERRQTSASWFPEVVKSLYFDWAFWTLGLCSSLSWHFAEFQSKCVENWWSLYSKFKKR